MEMIIGTLLDVDSSERTWPSGDRTIEHTAFVLSGRESVRVTLQGPSRDGRNPGLDPAKVKPLQGQVVALETYSRGGNNKRVYKTATRLLDETAIADALGVLAAS